MAANQAFKVLTEFKFETGQAVLNAGKLQQATDKISQSADSALFSLKKLGFGLVADFGLGASSALGVFSQALNASENFLQNQLTISNIISANMQNLTGDIGTFNDRMMVSKNILKDISKDARKFGLNENELAGQTKQLAALLVPKGLAGDNFSNARDISRNFLKSAPTLGVNAFEAQGQLQRSFEGSASMGDTLFRRLAGETQVFQDKFKGASNAAKAFNALPLKERFDLLNTGMAQFASDADVLAGQAFTMNRLLQTLRDTFTGFTGVLLPLGDAIAGPVKTAIKDVIALVDTDIRVIFKQLAVLIQGFGGDVKDLTVDLMQLKELSGDFKKASFVSAILGIGGALLGFASKFGLIGKVLNPVLLMLVGGFKGLFRIMLFLAGPALKIFGFLFTAVLRVLPVIALLTTFFQLISRARAIARVKDLELLPKIIGRLMTSFNNIKNVLQVAFQPIFDIFNAIARFIAPLFSVSLLLGVVATFFEKLEAIIIGTFALLIGSMHAVFQLVDNLKSGKILGAFDGVGASFNSGVDGFFDDLINSSKNADGSTAVAKNTTNIGKVEIKNEFKEKFEPDRIAFSLKEQLLKTAQNPTAARNRGFALSGIGR